MWPLPRNREVRGFEVYHGSAGLGGAGGGDGAVFAPYAKRAGARGAVPQGGQEAFENAVREAQDQLIRLERRAAAQDRDIFMVQRVLLEDEGLRQEVASYIRVGAGAAASVERAAGIFAGRIRALEDPYMREPCLAIS